MSMRLVSATLLIGLSTVGASNAETPPSLQAGAYEVAVKLELPNLDDMTASKSVTICLNADAAGGAYGLAVLSDNNPLGGCPISNVRVTGDGIAFDIACPGGNAAVASAAYVIAAERFTGRIAMKMGGKNMTMTETQAGRRVGDCANAVPPS